VVADDIVADAVVRVREPVEVVTEDTLVKDVVAVVWKVVVCVTVELDLVAVETVVVVLKAQTSHEVSHRPAPGQVEQKALLHAWLAASIIASQDSATSG
jgi:hypothetical protein